MKEKDTRQIGKLLGRLGIQKVQHFSSFWKALSRDHEDVAHEFEKALDERTSGREAPVHPIKNSSLEFANKVFSQFDGDRTKEFIAWLAREELLFNNANVLELGCDNGVFLCVCAALFPNVHFQGYDLNVDAINIARERKNQLRLNNVTFDRLPTNGWESLPENTYDFIFTQAVMHEVLNDKTVSSIEDIGEISISGFEFTPNKVELIIGPHKLEYLKCIRKGLKDSGYYISLERIPTSRGFHLWHHALTEVGLEVDYAKSYKLSFANHGKEIEKMPVTVARCNNNGSPPEWNDDFAFWIYETFLKHKNLTSINDPGVAKAMYLALDRKLAATIQIVWKNGSGIMRKVFGSAGSLCFSYTTTNQHFRGLVLVPSVCIHEVVENEAAGIYEMFADVDISVTVHDNALVDRMNLADLVYGLD